MVASLKETGSEMRLAETADLAALPADVVAAEIFETQDRSRALCCLEALD